MILDSEGWVFVAGSSKNMPGQVRSAVETALASRLGDLQAQTYLENMETSGRYQMETWS